MEESYVQESTTEGKKYMNHIPNNGPIFIVGAPRSGTTLLQYMLRSHPRISMPTGESHFIIPLYRNANYFGNLDHLENVQNVLRYMYDKSANFLETDLHGIQFNVDQISKELHDKGCNTIPKIISGLYLINAFGEGKERWGEKTPYYVLHIKTIIAMFPDAKIIHIIRDGRDCALSLFKRKSDFHIHNTYSAAKYWQQYVEIGQRTGRELGDSIYMEIRYEDILHKPIESMQRVCRFLGEGYDHSLVNFRKSNQPGKTPLLQKPIQKDNAGKWRKEMKGNRVRIFERAAGTTLSMSGYPLHYKSVKPLPLLLRALFRAHNRATAWCYKSIVSR
jgi:hypothetical protein